MFLSKIAKKFSFFGQNLKILWRRRQERARGVTIFTTITDSSWVLVWVTLDRSLLWLVTPFIRGGVLPVLDIYIYIYIYIYTYIYICVLALGVAGALPGWPKSFFLKVTFSLKTN